MALLVPEVIRVVGVWVGHIGRGGLVNEGLLEGGRLEY